MAGVQSFTDLIVWPRAIGLVAEIYRVTKTFPQSELYGLKSQLRRAAVSIPSNIAEGHARKGIAEFRNFLSIARGSLAEVETQLLISRNLDYLDQDTLEPLMAIRAEISKMQNSLLKKLAPRP